MIDVSESVGSLKIAHWLRGTGGLTDHFGQTATGDDVSCVNQSV